MYLDRIPQRKIFQFLNQINGNDVYAIDRNHSNYTTLFVKAELSNVVFRIGDFECVDVTNNVDHIKQWGPFMINQMNNFGKELGNRYVNDLHDSLEQGTIVGPVR